MPDILTPAEVAAIREQAPRAKPSVAMHICESVVPRLCDTIINLREVASHFGDGIARRDARIAELEAENARLRECVTFANEYVPFPQQWSNLKQKAGIQ